MGRKILIVMGLLVMAVILPGAISMIPLIVWECLGAVAGLMLGIALLACFMAAL